MEGHTWDAVGLTPGARGVAVAGNTIVFPIVGDIEVDDDDVHACTVIYSEDNGATWKFPAVPVIGKDCDSATLLEWEGKLLMATSKSTSWRRRVYESNDKGKTWTEAYGTLPRLLSQSDAPPMLYGSVDLMTATIEKRSVLLYTQLFSSSSAAAAGKQSSTHKVINLWLSDGARIFDVGPISADDAGFYPFTSLLHTQGGLFALYSKKGEHGGLDSLVFRPLTEQLQHIKSLLHTWKGVDDRVSTLCSSTTTATKGGTKAAGCVGPLPTAGLIGFLSNNASDTHWNDECLGLGATVSTGTTTKVENGFRLAGRGARIVWPMGRQESNPVRSYVGEELTLVATVTISKVPTGVTSLLGVSMMSPNGKRLGLWYDERRHWKTKRGEEGNASAVTWEVGTAYRVAFTLQKGGCSAYVDGQLVGSLGDQGVSPLEAPHSPGVGRERSLPEIQPEIVSDIYFGGYGEDAESHVTVTNVLLYSRRFNDSEIAALKRMETKHPTTAAAFPAQDHTGTKHSATGSAGGRSGSSGAASTHHAKTKAADSSVRGRLSGVLLSLLLLLVMWDFSALC
ncbi:trans-sialidase [Trypanosoma rangeli]|uniref:Trans-sialidase n=1 Tax=Trypanosoma rangeli TaxID=5698 RepID=A0A3R7NI40_TRYRA|nr:trans-sialidase [Trypanosoma rangeli]RNF02967.1 trans-sialidase [Trypanosoma rangeli]|eukprot:RNF02967.1 trans-sialidase [Trypanosoma rangeli]